MATLAAFTIPTFIQIQISQAASIVHSSQADGGSSIKSVFLNQ
jgi:hypothetical protein